MFDIDYIFQKQDMDKEWNAKKPLEYNIHFVEGKFGAGKTLYLVYNAIKKYDAYDYIYSNFPLYLPKNTMIMEITREKLFELNPKPDKYRVLLCLQEAYHYFDRRYWNEKINKGIMKALFQIRKLNVDIVADIRDILYLDYRIVKDITFFLKANRELKYYPGWFEYIPYRVEKNMFGNYDFHPKKPRYLYLKPVFDFYDTTQKTYDSFYENKNEGLES